MLLFEHFNGIIFSLLLILLNKGGGIFLTLSLLHFMLVIFYEKKIDDIIIDLSLHEKIG